jgi:lipoprotein-anchoring transpeptidase ErfK/SrfK
VQPDDRHVLVISVRDQRLTLLEDGAPIASYPVSTSKYGLGDAPGSYRTPAGTMRIRKKIGADAPQGAVFKDRKPTGEILAIDAPGRDPVVTRILWLDGLEPGNHNTYRRHIYIHGTSEERNIGRPASYGCIRMRSRDIVELFEIVGPGAQVRVTRDL